MLGSPGLVMEGRGMLEEGRQRGAPRPSARLLVPSPVAVVRHPDKRV